MGQRTSVMYVSETAGDSPEKVGQHLCSTKEPNCTRYLSSLQSPDSATHLQVFLQTSLAGQ